MIPMRDVNGRRSRTMDTAQVVMAVGMVQAILSVNGLPIPVGYEWINGVALAILGQWMIYLRNTTHTSMR